MAVTVKPMAIAIVTAKKVIHMGDLHGELMVSNADKRIWFRDRKIKIRPVDSTN
jgi:hypothetical protein